MGLFENSVPNTVEHTIFPIYRHTHISYWFYLYAYLDPIKASWFPHASLPPFSIPINISHLNTHEIGKFPVKKLSYQGVWVSETFPMCATVPYHSHFDGNPGGTQSCSKP